MLAGAAVAFLSHHAAHAQRPPARHAAPAAQAPAAPDGLAPDELYMEDDRITRDDKAKVTTAEGSVEIRYQGR
ncbi:MAG: organic solvent tolerance protein OstA, partial [Phenylobacterium sp.]|nr:organic solvent tolerance protein OstA [Phenylobacterium sp.]